MRAEKNSWPWISNEYLHSQSIIGFIRKMEMNEMLHQETILYHLEQAFYGGYTSRELRFFRLHRCWWRILGIKCVSNNFEIWMTSSSHWKSHQHPCHQHCCSHFSITNFSDRSQESKVGSPCELLTKLLSWFNWRFILSFFSFGLLAPMLLKARNFQQDYL